MRLVVLAHALYVAGGQSVALNIIKALIEQAEIEDLQLLIVVPYHPAYLALPASDYATLEFVKIRQSILGRLLMDEFILPAKVKQWQPDAIFALGNFGLRRHDAIQVTLFHNPNRVYPAPEIKRSLTTRMKVLLNDFQIRRTLPVTHKVYCQTDTMARRFRSTYRYENLGWLPNAVSRVCVDAAGSDMLPADIEQMLPCHGQRLFCLTRYYPHKNLELILECFLQHRDALRDTGVVFTLSKDDHPDAAVFLDNIRKAGLEQQLVNLGPVPQTLLQALYQKTDALLLPTLLESFSGTYVEAMQFGKTILTSDLDFAREICGDAAVYFNPRSIDSLRDAILALKGSTEIQALGARFGSTQMEKCTRPWQISVTAVLDDLQEMVRSPSSRAIGQSRK